MAETECHPIGVNTAIFQGLFNGLGDQIGRVFLMQFQDTDKLADAMSILSWCLQLFQKTLVSGWLLLAPAPDRLGMLEGAGTLF